MALGALTAARGFDEAQQEPAAQPAESAPQEGVPPGEGEQVGLQGILPPQVPFGLTFDDFAILDGNWQEWGEAVGEMVGRLYESEEPLSVPEQRQLLADLGRKLQVMERAMNDPQYRSISDRLISIHGRLRRRVELATAILDVLEMDLQSTHDAELSSARQSFQSALGNLQTYLSRVPNGGAWVPYLGLEPLQQAVQSDAGPEAVGPALEDTLQALGSRNQMQDPQQRQFLSRPPFLSFEAAAGRYLAALQRPSGDGLQQALREQLAALVEAAEEYESESALNAADRLRDAVGQLEAIAPPAAGRIEMLLRKYYFNYNLQVLISESFLARWISDARCQFQPVCERSNGAIISGSSVTRTVVDFDLKPSPENARFEVRVNGNTQANTRADTDQATIYAVGSHHFNAVKYGTFDGVRFMSPPAIVNVNPNTRITGAETSLDWIPIIGSIAENIALDRAQERIPQANAQTAQRIVQRVGGELDREINTNFADVERDLQTDLFSRLRSKDLYPQHSRISSSELYMRISSLIKGGDETAGGLPSPTLSPGRGLTVHLHESLLNNTINRVGFAGRTMTDQEVEHELEVFMTDLLGRQVDIGQNTADPQADEGPNVYIFDERDPIRFQIDNGVVNLIIRAGFKQDDGEDIPPQVVTVPLTPRLEGKWLYFDRGNVRVAPRERPENLAEQLARAGIIRKKVESDFGEMKRDRKYVFQREGSAGMVTYIMKVKALNGWMTLWIE